MLLLEGHVGNANLIFPHVTTLRTKVKLPQPVTKVKALLRGFDVAYADDDHNFGRLSVRLDVGYGDGANEVEVLASVELADEDPVGELLQVEVFFTLIAE